jgi:hypothetical protein
MWNLWTADRRSPHFAHCFCARLWIDRRGARSACEKRCFPKGNRRHARRLRC